MRWAVGGKGKKKKKKSRPFHAGPRSFTDARHSSIGFPLESSGPSSGTRDDNHNRETARISAPSVPIPSFSVQRWISPLSFLFFFFLPIEKTRRKGRKRNESKRTFERLVREIVASPLSSLLRTYFRSRIAKEWFEWRRLKPRFLFPSPFHSRAEYTSERKFPAPVTFPEQVVWKVDFWKGREWVKREKFLTVIDSTRRENRAIALHSLLDTLSDPFGGSSLATRPSPSTSTCFDSIHPFLLSSIRP